MGEKVSYQTAKDNLPADCLSSGKIGTSLGSFSISVALLEAFMEEFSGELEAKTGKLDTDPHWWMPMTLNAETYERIMTSKGDTPEQCQAHFSRMMEFKKKFLQQAGKGAAQLSNEHMLGGVGIGTDCYWWDYGQLKMYQKNVLLAQKGNDEAEAYRSFLNIAHDRNMNSKVGKCHIDKDSVVLVSELDKGKIKDSVVAKCRIGELDVEDSILVNVTARKVKGKGLVLYNVCDDSHDGLDLDKDTVRADVYAPGGGEKMSIITDINVDGGKAWNDKQRNSMSYAEVYQNNQNADMIALTRDTNSSHDIVAAKVGWFKKSTSTQVKNNGWFK